ncbi:methyltransferase domain-containing protein [Actinopolymorpha sp. B11F2]|uniref:class I SAM-dependent methyltransferase n=1 Tax=Actinopolymorpha sp. B11F2 TaxID=3160862 RepID=UPI0032E52D36
MAGDQNFLGARWTSALAEHAPNPLRRPVALWLLSLSPHYFYGRDREAESERNRTSRQQLANEILLPKLHPDFDVLDYGCGPGYLAHAVAPHVRTVHAVDISRGALACARVLNPAPNVKYDTPDGFATSAAMVDFAYSFAVAQHLTDDVLRTVLARIARSLRPNGLLYLHIVLDAPGWRKEASWRADTSLPGRMRMRVGLRCFARTEASVRAMVGQAGLTDVQIEPVAGRGASDDDIGSQHLLIARRPPR